MLKWLHIRNLALVSDAALDFSSGFNAVTGETGAGKSVLMGGLRLLLGARFEKNAIREGSERCEISGMFSVDPDSLERINQILDDAGVEQCDGDNLLIKRVFTPSGGKIFVNASAANSKLLTSLGAYLADIHGASATVTLLNPAEQLFSLDRFTGNQELLAECSDAWKIYTDALKEKEALLKNMPSSFEAERFRIDVEHIEKVNPKPGEDAEIAKIHSAAANSREILELSSSVIGLLTESEESLLERLAAIRRLLHSLERVDEEHALQFQEQLELISDSIRNLSDEISSHAETVDLDAETFAAMEERIRDLQTLKRKFGPTLENVLEYLKEAKNRLDIFENSEFAREKAEQKVAEAEAGHRKICKRLSEARKNAAEHLEAQLKKELEKLGFKRSEFRISFENGTPGSTGSDKIEFLFSANPGVRALPLREVASSGELCRVMLALKTVLAGADRIPTLVFDEIDANIGGETAVTVGEELAKLAQRKQIISISHLPQVAACAEKHFKVEKITSADTAETTVSEVTGKARIAEIARMLGGGAAALKHAGAVLNKKA
ncbi:MAG: DNA repair protein RecN [Lentisphaeria bacterium]|nr:DNA repair protein RecN [Lentisphaeria bacterium]MBQ7404638.1 DNA repair protein RecN [Lentisphaeria bacterium]